MRPLALKWRVSLLVAAAMVAVIAAVLIVSYAETRDIMYQQMDQTLTAMGKGAVTVFDSPETPDVQKAAIHAVTGVSHRKYSPFYRVWTGPDNELCSEGVPDRAKLSRVLAQMTPPQIGQKVFLDVEQSKEDYRAVWLRENTGQGLVNVVIALSTQEVESELNELLATLTVIGGGVAVGVVILVTLLVVWGLRPLGTTARQMVQVTAHNVGTVELNRDKAPEEVRPFVDSVSDMLARLDKAIQQQKAFVADASHELRTPMAAAKSTIQLALSKERAAPEYRSALTDTLDDLNRMEHLAEELLELARLDEAQGTVERAEVDLTALLEELGESFGARASQAGSRVELKLDPVTVRGHAGQLNRLFSNLLDNALKHGPKGGVIRVSAGREDARSVRVAVQDEGGRIPPETLPHLFERFYRVDPSRNHSTGGAGLGLAIAREIVLRHGGEISVASGPDTGTVVLVRFPSSVNG